MKAKLPKLYPLVLQPAYRNYIWGGNRIPKIFNRNLPPGVYAESWEVSDRPEGQSVVADGALAGWTLGAVLREYGSLLTGAAGVTRDFPLLIKLIDAKQSLSVQVHPNEATAPQTGGEPKTEAWYVLDHAPGAVIYAGFKSGMDEFAFRQALSNGDVAQFLDQITVERGDLIHIPGGLAHAIGAGCLLLEVQQNSNTTYRVYDWGRVGADGRPRELHVEQALRAMDWGARPQIIRAMSRSRRDARRELLATRYFSVEYLAPPPDVAAVPLAPGCQALFVAGGSVVLESPDAARRELSAGATVLIPASVENCRIANLDGASEVLCMR